MQKRSASAPAEAKAGAKRNRITPNLHLNIDAVPSKGPLDLDLLSGLPATPAFTQGDWPWPRSCRTPHTPGSIIETPRMWHVARSTDNSSPADVMDFEQFLHKSLSTAQSPAMFSSLQSPSVSTGLAPLKGTSHVPLPLDTNFEGISDLSMLSPNTMSVVFILCWCTTLTTVHDHVLQVWWYVFATSVTSLGVSQVGSHCRLLVALMLLRPL